jgi:hypothetical protein
MGPTSTDEVIGSCHARTTGLIIRAPDLIYPRWHQANLVADRFGEADLALHRPAR